MYKQTNKLLLRLLLVQSYVLSVSENVDNHICKDVHIIYYSRNTTNKATTLFRKKLAKFPYNILYRLHEVIAPSPNYTYKWT